MSVTTEQYQHHKDRLVGLLNGACDLPGLLDESARQIETARRKLQEDQFEIVLVGEFQGGKSTTFNNLCDGREISPRGKGGGGIKTSGCIVRARNLSDPGEEEHAIVRWRTPDELLMGFDAILKVKRRADGLDANQGIDEETATSPLSQFDPSTKKGRDYIRAAAAAEIKRWESDRARYDPDELGLIDLVRFALIVAEFYDHPVVRAARGRNRSPLAEIHRLVTFPEKWQKRWEEWKASAFQPEELLFAFVAQVDCHLHSPNLGRLGCAITDCPGLFASSWDTKVAGEALARADAVLYLIPGDRQLSQSNLKAIRALRLGKGMIFVGANCKTLTWEAAKGDILDANQSLLKNQGLDIEPQNIRPYHAALALFSKHLEHGVENLDPFSLEELRRDFKLEQADPALIETNLREMIDRFRKNLDRTDDGKGPSYAKSGMSELIDAVESFVIERKASAILLGNGDRVRIALSETEVFLQSKEDNALKTLQERQQEYEKAESALNEFETTTKGILADIGNDTHTLVAETFMDRLDSEKDAFIEHLSAILSDHIRKVEVLEWRNPKRQVNILINLSERKLNEWLQEQLDLWLADVRAGKNPAYRSTMTQPIQAFHSQLRHHWGQVKKKKIPALGGIDFPRQEDFQFQTGIGLPPDFANAIKGILNEVGTAHLIAAAIAALAIILVLVVILTALTAPVLLVLVPILAVFFPKLKEDLLGGGKNKLNAKFHEKFHQLEDRIGSELQRTLKKLVIDRKDGLRRKFIEHPRQVYKRIKKEAESQFQLSEADRAKAAKDAKQAREQHIAPLRERCESFLDEVTPLFPEHG